MVLKLMGQGSNCFVKCHKKIFSYEPHTLHINIQPLCPLSEFDKYPFPSNHASLLSLEVTSIWYKYDQHRGGNTQWNLVHMYSN